MTTTLRVLANVLETEPVSVALKVKELFDAVIFTVAPLVTACTEIVSSASFVPEPRVVPE